ncbi:cupredoxin domain-containing protein [Rossellomorea vietnamensis]|uniref:cupredoxin domain-containing protein n=1 Tax=Rossellomorea vietnamensis TaxID=218284 RepID=UPI003CF1A031
MKFVVLKKGSLILFIFGFIALSLGAVWMMFPKESYPTVSMNGESSSVQVIQMVTGEFSSETESGEKIESYRWDPGTIVVEKGKEVQFRILGINGMAHPFYIEGTDVRGTVKKGEESVFNMTFDKKGTYRLVCETHESIENDGPMIGYIVVK